MAKGYQAGAGLKNFSDMEDMDSKNTSFKKTLSNLKKRSKLKAMVKAPTVDRPNPVNPGNRAPGGRLPHSRRGAID